MGAMNVVKPGTIKKINKSPMPFKQREDIANFLGACRAVLKMKEFDLFTTADLYDKKSVVNFANGIVAFSRAAVREGFDGPSLGPKEAKVEDKRKSKWKIGENKEPSKLMMGSVATMERGYISKSGDITFGHDMSKK